MHQEHLKRYRAGDGPVFSSTKVPPGPGLEHSCELPFGFLWTPLSPPTDNEIATVDTAPMCLTCLAYLNMYGQVEEGTNRWTCPLCGAKNVAPPGTTDVCVQPVFEYRQELNASSSGNNNAVVLVMDENLPPQEARAVAKALQSVLMTMIEQQTANEPFSMGLVTFGKFPCVYQLARDNLASGDVYSTPELLTEERIKSRVYTKQVASANDLDSLWLCLEAVYGVSLDDSSSSNNNDIENQKPVLSRLEMLKMRKEARKQKASPETTAPTTSPWASHPFEPHPLRCTAEALQCAIHLVDTTIMSRRTARILLFTNGCPNYGDASVVTRHEQQPQPELNNKLHRPDVVDPVQLARAVEYLDLLAQDAAQDGIAMDVFCSGALELALPSYQALVEPSAGYVLPHLSFAENREHLKRNLDFCVQQTFVSGLHHGENSTFKDENWTHGCIIDLRMPSFITPTHLVGPGEILDDAKSLLVNERAMFAAGSALAAENKMKTNNLPSVDMVETTLTRVRLGRYDPMSTFSVMLQVNEFFQRESYALFQCTVRFVDRGGKTLVTRVFTNRLTVARDTGEFLDAVDEEVVPVLLGKEAVYRSMFGREMSNESGAGERTGTLDTSIQESLAYDAQRDLDATIQKISGAYRLLGLECGTSRRGFDLTEEGGIQAAGSSIDFAFPPELADALRRLYHFRRGPILSPGPMQSMDDRAEIRSLFIRFPLEDCLGLMALSLWTSGPIESPNFPAALEVVPPDTLALWDNCILAGDHYFVMFLWSGKATKDSAFDGIRQQLEDFLVQRSQNRFPAPTLHILNENDSMSRRFTALLAPSHGDPVEHQLTNFPALGTLSPTELSQLQSKFKFYDPETDASFRNWFWSVSSASSKAKDEGISLCD